MVNSLQRHGLKLSIGILLGLISFCFLLRFVLSIGWELFLGDEAVIDISSIDDLSSAIVSFKTYIGLTLVLSSNYFLAGLAGSFSEAVYRDQSSFKNFMMYGSTRFWENLKITAGPLAIFFLIVLSKGIPYIVLFILFLLFIPVGMALNHACLIRYEKKLSTLDSLQAGLKTLTKLPILTIINGLLALPIMLVLYLLTLGFKTELSSFFMSGRLEPNTSFMFLLLLALPLALTLGQMVITTRFKDQIEPLINFAFPNTQTNPFQGPNQTTNHYPQFNTLQLNQPETNQQQLNTTSNQPQPSPFQQPAQPTNQQRSHPQSNPDQFNW
ncbi:hypothetical protein [Thermoactinomyces sp. DSM 45892]|uniref:hypothetical protein n=1 Tax=Thermoactinomyces sp. DSM 45892 TaxID=1882753 RepID=UPI000897A351|nr:hypothetical protein [Thermoactinomyces sp. DSM 45892]SDZ17071.1 hypothetical protein SAMN05444416_11537 [Thermoactinomyces sp. DSM 45892]